MDQFVKRFFSQYEAPGAEFKFGNDGCFGTFLKGTLSVYYKEYNQTRAYTMNQGMTALGRTHAAMIEAGNSLDGMTKNYLTPEGTMNLTVLGETLKSRAGVSAQVWSAHMGMASSWPWLDNHVGLLYNMLRFTFMRKLTSVRPNNNLSASLGIYDDGHVNIDMDQYFDEAYPAVNEWEWPGGNISDNYPEYIHLTSNLPETSAEAVDLRGLNVNEAQFILLMLGAWRRRSRFRLDFQSDVLCDAVYYRYSQALTVLNNCFDDTAANQRQPMPQIVNHQTAWSAIRKYVSFNRLYEQFSTALFMLSATAYQFKPSSAESVWWMSVEWTVTLPIFRSIRGRYTVLNEGEAAFLSHRALTEWGYINSKLEKVNLMALVFSQAIFTGCAVRATRLGIEVDPSDIYATEMEFYKPSSMVSAAASEAIKAPVPMSGMPDVCVYTSTRFDDYDTERIVPTLIPFDEQPPNGYQWYPEGVLVATTVDHDDDPDDGDDHPEEGEGPGGNGGGGDEGGDDAPRGQQPPPERAQQQQQKPAATEERREQGQEQPRSQPQPPQTRSSQLRSQQQKNKDIPLPNVFDNLSWKEGRAGKDSNVTLRSDKMQYRPAAPAVGIAGRQPAIHRVQVVEQVRRQAIVLPLVPICGAPTLLLPLKPFNATTPFDLAGVIDKKQGIAGRRGWAVGWYLAWEVANLMRLCGYNVTVRDDKSFAGPNIFFSPNDVNMTWPLLRSEDDQPDLAILKDMQPRANNWIILPAITTKVFDGELKYRTDVSVRGVCTAAHLNETTIKEYGGRMSMIGSVNVTYSVPEGVTRMRGYITRATAGFQFVGDVQAGEIPTIQDVADARGVVEV